jgi:glutathione synthase/RimK-type ligase-like ATP-grasp enzyme
LGRWGQQLEQVAIRRGHEAYLFNGVPLQYDHGDYVFMRIPQWEPELRKGKACAKAIQEMGGKLIPDYFTIASYEDKVMQTRAYSAWMPKTFIIDETDNWRMAANMARELNFPFISKSKEASSSVNCRIIRNMAEAREEYHKAILGDGIDTKVGKGRLGKQVGYLLWQKFLPNNPCDYRVLRVGRRMCMLQRDNAPGTPFASGSGSNRPINDPNIDEMLALRTASQFFEENELKWNGIDLVYDWDEKDWKVLETTLGWSMAAYLGCHFFGTERKGREIFDLLIDEIEAGVFE